MEEKKHLIADFTKEEFIDLALNNYAEFEKYSISDIGKAIIEHSLSDKKIGSLKISKPKLRDIIKEHDKPLESNAKVHKNTSSNKASDNIVNFFDDMKKIAHNSSINPLLKGWSIKALDSLLSKVTNEDKLNSLGFIGNGLILGLTAIDVVFSLDRVALKIKEKIQSREDEKKKIVTVEVTPNNDTDK